MDAEIVAEIGIGSLGPIEDLGAGDARLGEDGREGGDRLGPAGRLTHPDRQRCSPVTLPGEGPVDVCLEEVAEPPLLDVLREPVDASVVGEHRVAELAGANEPARTRVLDEGIAVGPPTEGIIVDILLLMDQEPAGLEVAGDVAIAFLDEPAAPHRELVGEGAVGGDAIEQRRAPRFEARLLGHQHAIIDLAEGGGDMDDAGARVGGDEVGRHDAPRRR